SSTPAADPGTEDTAAQETSEAAAQGTQDAAGTQPGIGTKEGNVYQNDYLNIRFELPDGWSVMTDEQINAVMQVSQQVFSNTDLKEVLDSGNVYYDLYAVSDAIGGDNVNVTLQSLSALQITVTDSQLTEDMMLQVMGPQFENTYKQMGATDYEYEIRTIRFRGEDKQAIHQKVVLYGVEMEQCVVIVIEGDYMATVSSTSTKGEADALVSAFTEAR
ncbi:MAG: hypothetical protein IJP92_07295, partial [Lachnospiraceae bacterium]|nr:hypothetical protein [Lachnospiraceae bacterium]